MRDNEMREDSGDGMKSASGPSDEIRVGKPAGPGAGALGPAQGIADYGFWALKFTTLAVAPE
jgi:hypothetical protein